MNLILKNLITLWQQIWQKKWVILFWASLIIVTFLLFIELPPKPEGIPYLDKIQHIFIFIILYTFGAMAWKPHGYWFAGALILYGGLVEPLQSIFTRTRQASVYDWLADVAGVAIAFIFFKILHNKLKPSTNKN
jgi:VanZ family protein